MSCWRGLGFHRFGCNGDNLHYGLYGQEQSCISEDIFPSYFSVIQTEVILGRDGNCIPMPQSKR